MTNDDAKAKADYDIFMRGYIEKRGLKTMREVLEEYNIVDVLPFVEALEKTRQLYFSDKIDVLKDAVSIPGLSMRYALNKALKVNKDIKLYAPGSLCSKCRAFEEDCKRCDCVGAIGAEYCQDCRSDQEKMKKCKCDERAHLLKTGMVGGPAVVFCRYQEAGVMQIRSHKYEKTKPCAGAIGYDANALYLYIVQALKCRVEKTRS